MHIKLLNLLHLQQILNTFLYIFILSFIIFILVIFLPINPRMTKLFTVTN